MENWKEFIASMEADMSGDELDALNAMREHYRKLAENAGGEQPNLIERLENIDALCDELRSEAGNQTVRRNVVLSRTSDIEGIVGEILTMIDGR